MHTSLVWSLRSLSCKDSTSADLPSFMLTLPTRYVLSPKGQAYSTVPIYTASISYSPSLTHTSANPSLHSHSRYTSSLFSFVSSTIIHSLRSHHLTSAFRFIFSMLISYLLWNFASRTQLPVNMWFFLNEMLSISDWDYWTARRVRP